MSLLSKSVPLFNTLVFCNCLQDFEIEMNWNLMEFLPEQGGIRKYFSDIIAGYIHAIYSQIIQVASENNTDTPKRRKTTLSQLSQRTPMGVDSNEDIAVFARDFISNKIQNKLFL